MLTVEELKNDINLGPYWNTPTEVLSYIFKHASSHSSYCTWLQIIGGEIYMRTWAFQCKKTDGYTTKYTEVERYCPLSDYAIRRNMRYTMYGYFPVYEKETKKASTTWYGYTYFAFTEEDFDKWFTEKPMGIYSPIINLQKLFECEKYKYCGYNPKDSFTKYIREYNKDPMVEYFGKMGLRVSSMLVKKCRKDRQFMRFLRDHVSETNTWGPAAAIEAYKSHMSIREAAEFNQFKNKTLRWTRGFPNINLLSANERIKIYRWAHDSFNYVNSYLYLDYWRAIVGLGLDLHDTKNTMPHDFQRMHDLRVNQWDSERSRRNRKKDAAFKKEFALKAKEWKPYEMQGDTYAVVVPERVNDLVREGELLHHCVGEMGYDKRMAKGQSLIVFIRKVEDITTPYVTVEYLPTEKKLAQVYGEHDSKPDDDVRAFVNEWAKKLTKDLKRREKENALQQEAAN